MKLQLDLKVNSNIIKGASRVRGASPGALGSARRALCLRRFQMRRAPSADKARPN